MTRIRNRYLLFSLLIGFALHCQAAGVELPARFEANRIVLVPRTTDGTTLEFYTDTGGGFNAISASAASRLLASPVESGDTISFPDFDPGAAIPSNPIFEQGRLAVVDDGELAYDGFLGGRWFGGKIWELDYLRDRIVLHDHYDPPAGAAAHGVPLGFQTDASGARTTHFASIPIEVDGQELLVLFDTGARAELTQAAANVFDVSGGTVVGASFIIDSVFEEWKRKHPAWLVVPDADLVKRQTFAMIRVPSIRIAGHEVGPVWFAERPDQAFEDYMSQWMDRTVHGAIGGSAFQYFRIVIDYPAATAWFFRD